MSLPLTVLLVVLQPAPVSCASNAARPLFECDTPLELEIAVDTGTLMRRKEDRPVLDANLTYVDATGAPVNLDVQLTTRGHSRLAMCSFPPLSLLMDKDVAEGTIFAGQKKLKIVTQCRDGERYLDHLRQEYGVYRAYDVLAEPAFRTRLLHIIFRDTKYDDRSEEHLAFFIEPTREVARRTGLDRVKLNQIPPERLDPKNSSIYELFQFMIANTDWSKTKGPGEEECCHNGKVLAPPKSESGWLVLPYDFDQAGIINTPYALPDERLPIHSVRQRLFRGRCEFIGHMDDTVALFNEQRGEVESALASGGVSDKRWSRQRKFLARFYDIVNDPKLREKHIDKRCRGVR